jgi:hypothetical protein
LGDDSSERSILSPPAKAKNAIMRTTHVAVKYDARSHSEEEAGAFEMADHLPIQKTYGSRRSEIARAS